MLQRNAARLVLFRSTIVAGLQGIQEVLQCHCAVVLARLAGGGQHTLKEQASFLEFQPQFQSGIGFGTGSVATTASVLGSDMVFGCEDDTSITTVLSGSIVWTTTPPKLATYAVRYYGLIADVLGPLIVIAIAIPFAVSGVRVNPAVGAHSAPWTIARSGR